MSKKDRDIVEYIVCCVSEFAKKYALTQRQAYAYLKRFMGINFLRNHYDIEHTLSIEEAVEDMQMICARNGGRIGL